MTSDTWLLTRTYFAVASLRAEEAVDLSVDFGQKQSIRAVTLCRLHSLPQRTIPHPARVQPSNTTWPTSQLCQQTREDITILMGEVKVGGGRGAVG